MKFKYIGAVTLTSIVLCIALQSVQETKAEGSGDNDESEISRDQVKAEAGIEILAKEEDEVALRRRGSSGGSRGSSGGKSSGGSKGSSSGGSKGSRGSSSSSGRGTKHTSKSSTKSFTKKAVTFAAGAYTAKKAAKMAKKVDSSGFKIIQI